MIELYVCIAALVASAIYINFLNWRLGKLAGHIETQRALLEGAVELLEESKDGD